MRTRGWKPAVVSMSVAACILAVAQRDAAACSPSGCTEGRAFPASGTTVPANLPAVGFWGLYSGATTLLELRDGQGALVPTVIGGDGSMQLLLLSSQLVEGASYTLRYDDDCKPTTPHEHVFVAGAASAVPSAFGTLTLVSHRVESIKVRHSGSCFADRVAAAATFELALSPEMIPHALRPQRLGGPRGERGQAHAHHGRKHSRLRRADRRVARLRALVRPGL